MGPKPRRHADTGRFAAALIVAVFAAPTLLAADARAVQAPQPTADLALSKSDNPDPVAVRTPVTYTLTAVNLGPNPAPGVRLVDRLPASFLNPTATTTAGSCEVRGRTVSCELGTIGVGTAATTVTVTIAATPTRPGRFTNSATVSSRVRDPRPGNDLATESTRVLPVRVATCLGRPATVIGTAAADRLVGTRGNDVVLARRGDDVIRTFAGHDLVCAGRGADVVRGGVWADRVFGNGGGDRLIGQGGADKIFGNAGRDLLLGRSGADKLNGGDGFDTCRGGRGADLEIHCQR